jgi:hypothetical protein
MIIAFLSGGLGNQMFQFAAAEALALKTKQTLKLDLSFYKLYNLNRQFELDKVFKYKFDIATKRDLKNLLGLKVFFHKSPVFRKVLKKIGTGKNWLVEPHFHFYSDFFKSAGNCLIEGDWQSEKYFKDYTDKINDAFTFNLESFTDYDLLRQIKESNSVGIHLRRGDYVTNKHTLSWHGICGKEYYVKAIDFLRQKFSDLKFFVFSDDINAARKELCNNDDLFFVENDSKRKNHFDMFLMSSCKHNIIANSTFSWWAAWLNDNKDKIVVAPKSWFANRQLSDKDLILQDWKRI